MGSSWRSILGLTEGAGNISPRFSTRTVTSQVADPVGKTTSDLRRGGRIGSQVAITLDDLCHIYNDYGGRGAKRGVTNTVASTWESNDITQRFPDTPAPVPDGDETESSSAAASPAEESSSAASSPAGESSSTA